MVNSLRFSVIVTCYNYEAYVCAAIESALAQTTPPHEVIVVNDGSTDGSLAKLSGTFGGTPSVRLLSQDNAGQLAAFATGCRAATGDVVCFLDADDLWEPGYLQALVAAYGGKAQPGMVLSNLRRFGDEQGVWHEHKADRDLGVSVLATWALHRFTASPTSSISMRRALALQALEVPETFHAQWRTRADDCLIFGANLLSATSVALAYPHVGYRIHGANHWAGRNLKRLDYARYTLQLATLAEYHGRRAGLSVRHLHYAMFEFKTKSYPSWHELLSYLWLQWQAPRSWLEKLRPCAAILKHFVTTRVAPLRL